MPHRFSTMHMVIWLTPHCSAEPSTFSWFSPKLYTPVLAYLMLSVGINLKLE